MFFLNINPFLFYFSISPKVVISRNKKAINIKETHVIEKKIIIILYGRALTYRNHWCDI